MDLVAAGIPNRTTKHIFQNERFLETLYQAGSSTLKEINQSKL